MSVANKSPRASQRLRVLVIVANVKEFRSSFYGQLAIELESSGIELRVQYSDPSVTEATKKDSIDLSAPIGRKIARLYMLDDRILVQFPNLRDVIGADLLIVVQANGYVLNYLLLLLSVLRLKRVAFWGHGYNHQGTASSISERIKRRMVNVPDWWFAYTKATAEYVMACGMQAERITVIENAIDTSQFTQAVSSVTQSEMQLLRDELGVKDSDRIALFCGSLYREKRIGYMLDVALQVAQLVPGFRLIIVGAGPEEALVQRVARDSNAILYLGPQFGRRKATVFRISEAVLNPGAVGLGILDSFAAGLPLVTSAEALHGPEREYLKHRVNGLVISGDAKHFAHEVAQLFRNKALSIDLRRGARESAKHYTIENMVQNVAQGVIKCLKS
jgi:glycosyltransferase involved in cell wall biosynthesis